MKRITKLTIIFLTFYYSLGEGVSEKKGISIWDFMSVEEANNLFMINFFQDTLLVEKYFKKIECDSLRTMVLISKKYQELYVLEFSDTFHISFITKVSTGKINKWTPSGEFKILKKMDSRPSTQFGGTMLFWNGITDNESHAIHGLKKRKDYDYEKDLGKPMSHGCIRISNSVAEKFYTNIPIGTLVLIQ